MNNTQMRLTSATAICAFLASQAFGAAELQSGAADKIRAEVADIVAGINAHDVDQATKYDADDIVSIKWSAGIEWHC